MSRNFNAMLFGKIHITLAVFFVLLYCSVSGHEAKASLAFVIDSTMSMSNEIENVRQRTNDVFEATVNSNASQIDEFIIVTFNDPEHNSTKPATLEIKTNKREYFRRALENIEVSGGGDCPEMAMSGIELALKESKPNSLLYVLTDASAKDHSKYESVKTLTQEKSIQVSFLLTGECSEDKEGHDVYDELASNTSGQVFHIHKPDISKIIDYIIVNIKNKRTVLLQKEYKDEAECKDKYKFTVDNNLRDILIAITANRQLPYQELLVIGPGGEQMGLQNLIRSPKTHVTKVIAEGAGEYSVDIRDCKNITITVTASRISF